jgi:hypothetical protein
MPLCPVCSEEVDELVLPEYNPDGEEEMCEACANYFSEEAMWYANCMLADDEEEANNG